LGKQKRPRPILPIGHRREPIVAYRSWNVLADSGGWRLASNRSSGSNSPAIWPPFEPTVASCLHPHLRQPKGHGLAPAEGCSCGIYGRRACSMTGLRWGHIVGAVSLWGKVIGHQSGYRAEYAYPHTLLAASCCLCGKLRPFGRMQFFAIPDLFGAVGGRGRVASVSFLCLGCSLGSTVADQLFLRPVSLLLDALQTCYGVEVIDNFEQPRRRPKKARGDQQPLCNETR